MLIEFWRWNSIELVVILRHLDGITSHFQFSAVSLLGGYNHFAGPYVRVLHNLWDRVNWATRNTHLL